MKLDTTKSITAAILIAAIALAIPPPVGADLIGDTITATGYPYDPPLTATIGAGTEFLYLGGLYFDFSASTLTIAGGALNFWGGFGGDDGQKLAFVGYVEGVEAEHFAGGPDGRANGDGGFVEEDGHLGLAGDFVEGAGDAASGGVAQDVDRRTGLKHGGDEMVQGGDVADYVGFEAQFAAGAQDGDAVVADGAGEQNDVARLGQVAGT